MPRSIVVALSLALSLAPGGSWLRPALRAFAQDDAAPTHRTLHFVGEARQVGTPRTVTLEALSSRQGDGFLVALDLLGDKLVVAEHDADGDREAVHRLGPVGYTGALHVTTLQALSPTTFVAGMDYEWPHYSEIMGSLLMFVHGREVRSFENGPQGPAPIVVPDGDGGAIGFFERDGRTIFGRWDGQARLRRTRPIAGTSMPLRVAPFRGGVLLASAGRTEDEMVLESFDRSGRRRDARRLARGEVASNGTDVVVTLATSSDHRSLSGRFGDGPATLGASHVLAEAPPGQWIVAPWGVITTDRFVLVSWSLFRAAPDLPAPGCGIWVRAFDRYGTAVGAAVCASETPGFSRLAVRGTGTWMAWNDFGVSGLASQVWVRRLELD